MKMRTLNEAAQELGTTRAYLRTGVLSGKFPCYRWGNRYLVDLDIIGPIVAAEKNTADTISAKDCALAIGLTPDALLRMAKAGVVPYHREGRYYRFRVAEVEAALREGMK